MADPGRLAASAVILSINVITMTGRIRLEAVIPLQFVEGRFVLKAEL
jgi:hypothetical protein